MFVDQNPKEQVAEWFNQQAESDPFSKSEFVPFLLLPESQLHVLWYPSKGAKKKRAPKVKAKGKEKKKEKGRGKGKKKDDEDDEGDEDEDGDEEGEGEDEEAEDEGEGEGEEDEEKKEPIEEPVFVWLSCDGEGWVIAKNWNEYFSLIAWGLNHDGYVDHPQITGKEEGEDEEEDENEEKKYNKDNYKRNLAEFQAWLKKNFSVEKIKDPNQLLDAYQESPLQERFAERVEEIQDW